MAFSAFMTMRIPCRDPYVARWSKCLLNPRPSSTKEVSKFLSPLALSILLALFALVLFERLADEMIEGDTL